METVNNSGDVVLYTTDEGGVSISVLYKDETFWLSQKAMAELFECTSDNISLHLKNIFSEGELDKDSVTEKISAPARDGKKYVTQFYNLDAIIVKRKLSGIAGKKQLTKGKRTHIM